MGIVDFLLGEQCTLCGSRTHNTFRHRVICSDCQDDIEAEERLKAAIEAEGVFECPSCQTHMDKTEMTEGLFIDKCPNCKGVFLDGGELEKIKEMYYSKGEDSNEGSGFVTGVVVGSLLDG